MGHARHVGDGVDDPEYVRHVGYANEFGAGFQKATVFAQVEPPVGQKRDEVEHGVSPAGQ